MSPGTVVTPGDLAGLTLWLKADAITGLSDGAAVASWLDSSGSNMPANQPSVANRPVYITNATNGLPVVRFGASASMDSNASASYAQQTIVAVVKPNAPNADNHTIRGALGNAGGLQTFIDVDGYSAMNYERSGGIGRSSSPASTAGFQVITYTFATNAEFGIWYGTTFDGSGATGVASLTPGTTAAIGYRGGGGEYFNGDIAEIACYDRVLTIANITTLARSLATKWNAPYMVTAIDTSDVIAPNAPYVATGATVGSVTPRIAGTAESLAIVSIAVNGHTYDGFVSSNGAWSISITDALIANQTYTLSVTAIDTAGNSSPVTLHNVTVTLSASASMPVFVEPNSTTHVNPTMVGTADPETTITLTVNGSGTYTSRTDPYGSWAVIIGETLSLGSHGLSATATDAQGLVSAPASWGITVVAPDRSTTPAPAPYTNAPNIPGTPLASGGSISLNFSRLPWFGGPSYYAQFADMATTEWTSDTFFPILLWWGGFSSDAEAQWDKDHGINTYCILGPGTDAGIMERTGMWLFGGVTMFTSQNRSERVFVGDFLDDEQEEHPETYAAEADALPDHNKIRYANHAGPFMSWQSLPAYRTNYDKQTYTQSITDVCSVDSYYFDAELEFDGKGYGFAFLSPYNASFSACTPQNYGRTIKSMAMVDWRTNTVTAYQHQNQLIRQPLYNFIENTYSCFRSMLTPERQKAAAMASIIAGANGINWFNQCFDGTDSGGNTIPNIMGSGNAIRSAQVNSSYAGRPLIEAMSDVNHQLQYLAPVLNSQSYNYNFGPDLETMLKVYGGFAYILVMTADQRVAADNTITKVFLGTRTLNLPSTLQNKPIISLFDPGMTFTPGTTIQLDFSNINRYYVLRVG